MIVLGMKKHGIGRKKQQPMLLVMLKKILANLYCLLVRWVLVMDYINGIGIVVTKKKSLHLQIKKKVCLGGRSD